MLVASAGCKGNQQPTRQVAATGGQYGQLLLGCVRVSGYECKISAVDCAVYSQSQCVHSRIREQGIAVSLREFRRN